ncbi:MAG: hypothetical protein EBR54_02550 [Flavobacteriia bacterium]|nr:hypothetical protein [Flavobacteriia bacterium]
MGGAKETPRQKMISMMYIVLTALLALNVSKQILDAFVAIEANIQKGALTQLQRGDDLKGELKSELATSKSADEAEKRKKIENALKSIAEIDKEAQVVIKNIDDAKLLLLEKLGELPAGTPATPDAPDKILWVKYSPNQPLLPSKLNLTALQAKDEFDTPMRELGIVELEEIDKNGVGMAKLWLPYKGFRKRLVEICGTYSLPDKSYKVTINGSVDKFKDNKDLESQVGALISKGNKVNEAELPELVTIYSELTKMELDKYGHDGDIQENVHWLGRTFFHAPMIAALASLSTLQYEILAARAKAVGLIKSRISTGEYSFNKISALARPSVAVASSGDKFEVYISMAAYDTDKPPVLKAGYPGTLKEIKDGVATLELTASGSNEMTISGTVGIANKMGSMKWEEFNTKIFIAEKGGGSIGLPLQTALYAEWDNKITASAGGSNIKSMTVSCNGKNCPKVGGYYVARVTPSKDGATIIVNAKDKDDKPVTFKQSFPIRPFPEPTILTASLSAKGGPIYVGLPPGAVMQGVQFIITEMKVGSTKVSGNIVPANALRAFSPGSVVGIYGSAKRADTGKMTTFKGSIQIQ